MSKWRTFKEATADIEGWFHDAASAACDAMLRQQAAEGVHGDMLEIGAWHGKSAALWLLHARANETVHVVDYDCHEPLRPNLERVAALAGSRVNLTKGTSLRFPDAAFLAEHRRKLRLIHIDGDHSAAGVTNDLNVCAELLNPVRGFMVIDDFMSWRFPQITEATAHFLASRRHEFAMFACGDNKAFICTAKGYDKWREFVGRLGDEINALVPATAYEGAWEGRPIVSFRR